MYVELKKICNVKIKKLLSASDIELIKKSFKSHFVFFSLPEEQIGKLIEKMFYCTVKEGEYIFKQGD